MNTGPTEVFEAHLDSSVTPTQGRKEVYAQASDCGKIGKTAGLGMVSMRERMHLIGGEFTISSQPGGGTKIQAKAPLALSAK